MTGPLLTGEIQDLAVAGTDVRGDGDGGLTTELRGLPGRIDHLQSAVPGSERGRT